MPAISLDSKENDGRKKKVSLQYGHQKMSGFGLTWFWLLPLPVRVVTWASYLISLSSIRWGYCSLPGSCSTGVPFRKDQGNRSHRFCFTLTCTGRKKKTGSKSMIRKFIRMLQGIFENLTFTADMHCYPIETYMFFYSEYLKNDQSLKEKLREKGTFESSWI